MGVRAPTVRPMTPADVAAVAGVEVDSFADPWPPAVFFEELALPRRAYVVIEDEGHIVGYGGLMLVDEDAHVMTLAVDPDHRRRGLGTRLLAALVDAALERGSRHLTLEVRQSNAAATALYQRFGFTAVGRRPRYYQDAEDAVIMWAVDVDRPEYRRRVAELREGRG